MLCRAKPPLLLPIPRGGFDEKDTGRVRGRAHRPHGTSASEGRAVPMAGPPRVRLDAGRAVVSAVTDNSDAGWVLGSWRESALILSARSAVEVADRA